MTGNAIMIELSGIPKGKGRPRFVRATGIAFTPADTRKYESALRYAAQEAMGSRVPLEGLVSVAVEAHFPVPQSWSRKKRDQALAGLIRPATKPDADNLLKCVDSFNEIVFRDDKQIVDARISKFYSDRPRLSICIEPVADGQKIEATDGRTPACAGEGV